MQSLITFRRFYSRCMLPCSRRSCSFSFPSRIDSSVVSPPRPVPHPPRPRSSPISRHRAELLAENALLLHQLLILNQQAKREGRIRLLLVPLPSRSPWLNAIEAVFGQAKRHIVGNRSVRPPSRLKQKTERYYLRREKRMERVRATTICQT